MKELLANLGVGDGEGSISHTRLINVLAGVCWLVSKFYNSHLTHQPITWDSSDLAFIGTIGGISIGKSIAEKPSTTVVVPTTITSSTTTNP